MWENDQDVPNCRSCQVKFSLIKRRHHCRGCGKIFCGECSSLVSHIPGSSDKVRVCDVCFLRFSSDHPTEPDQFKVVFQQKPHVASLSRWRLNLVSTGNQVVKSIHIFSIKRITSSDGCRVELLLDEHEDTTVLVLIDFHRLQVLIDQCLQNSSRDTVERYCCWCDFFFSPPDPSLLQHLIDSARLGDRTLNLSLLPGAHASDAALDLRPLCRALRSDTHFQALHADALPRREAVGLICDQLIPYNTGITELKLCRVPEGHNGGIERLGPHATSLVTLDLHETQLPLQAVESLTLPRLTTLSLAQCRMQGRELSALMQRLTSHAPMLTSLDVSGNRFTPESSDHLARWLASATCLRYLVVKDASLRVESLFEPAAGALPTLRELIDFDISGNSMRNFSGSHALQLVSLTASFVRLSHFSLRDTHADPVHVIVPILSLLLTNQDIACALDVSGCSFSDLNSTVALRKGLQVALSNSLHQLDLSRTRFPSPHALRDVLLALIPSQALQKLTLNDSLAPCNNAVHLRMLGRTLATLSHHKPTLKSLHVASMGEHVTLSLFQSLTNNTSLLDLDVSNNNLRDAGATVVALFLRINHTLQSLALDDNHIGLSGFLAIKTALTQTADLKTMTFPWNDFNRISATAKAVVLEIRDILTIRTSVKNQISPSPSPRPPPPPPRDDESLHIHFDVPSSPPPLPPPYPVDSHDDEPKTDVLSAIRQFQKSNMRKVQVAQRSGNATLSQNVEPGQIIGNALWSALNARRRVIEEEDDDEEQELEENK